MNKLSLLVSPLHPSEVLRQGSHHVVAGQQSLQELGLFVLDGFNDELVIAGQVEERAAGPGVGQLDQRLIDQGVLREEHQRTNQPQHYTNMKHTPQKNNNPFYKPSDKSNMKTQLIVYLENTIKQTVYNARAFTQHLLFVCLCCNISKQSSI